MLILWTQWQIFNKLVYIQVKLIIEKEKGSGYLHEWIDAIYTKEKFTLGMSLTVLDQQHFCFLSLILIIFIKWVWQSMSVL